MGDGLLDATPAPGGRVHLVGKSLAATASGMGPYPEIKVFQVSGLCSGGFLCKYQVKAVSRAGSPHFFVKGDLPD